MKKLLLAFGILLLGGFVFLNYSSLEAQEISSKSASIFESSGLEKVADAIWKLADVLSSATTESKSDIKADPSPAANAPLCVNSPDLPRSFKKKTGADWNLNLVVGSGTTWLDINGDGLLDYMYYSKTKSSSSTQSYVDEHGSISKTIYSENSCVGLNTGNGWNVVYRCFSSLEDDGDPATTNTYNIVYYGNCADTFK